MTKKILLLAALAVGGWGAEAQQLWSSGFNVVSGTPNGTQPGSGNNIESSATLAGWSVTGYDVAAVVQVTNTDWALLIFGKGGPFDPDVATASTSVAADANGTKYWVSLDLGPGVFAYGPRASKATDTLVVNVLNPANTVIASSTFNPGAWAGTETFHQVEFSYFGNGSGDVRLQLLGGDPALGDYVGAINQVSIWGSDPTPEPSTIALTGVGLAALVGIRRKKHNPQFLLR